MKKNSLILFSFSLIVLSSCKPSLCDCKKSYFDDAAKQLSGDYEANSDLSKKCGRYYSVDEILKEECD
jgi:hypothetical protein